MKGKVHVENTVSSGYFLIKKIGTLLSSQKFTALKESPTQPLSKPEHIHCD